MSPCRGLQGLGPEEAGSRSPGSVGTHLSLVDAGVKGRHLSEAQAVHKVVLLPAGHQDGHLCDTGGL